MGPPRREQILAAARDLFLEVGLAGVSMRRVAERVGVSAPALYRHFSSKDALLAAVVDHGFQLLGTTLFGALAGRTPIARLWLAGTLYLRFAREQPQFHAILLEGWGQLRVEAHRTRAAGDVPPTLQFLVDRVRECMPGGPGRQGGLAFEVAIGLWSQCHGLASLFVGGGASQVMDAQAYQRLCEAVLARALEGLRAQGVLAWEGELPRGA